MPPIRLTGFVIVLVGLLSGLVLVAQPFFALGNVAPLVLLLLFLGCLSFGLPLYAAGDHRQRALRLSGGALLLLGLVALIGVFVDAAGVRAAQQSTALLWLLAPTGIFGGLLLAYFAGALDRLDGKAR
ncbi:hypothetical protein [Azospira restricta]|uniref:Transmembrane protein n=1 Tax=Azospira restricta TaxID=404405 RepID=A0A974PWZ4_9RHOO|nr:hypothetical protein [Azospira restricta]QRJ62836.1 hypothetical protein IWH25_13825 [Azospira restricta]